MAKPLSGRKATVHISTSTPAAFGPLLGTFDSDRKIASFATDFWHDSTEYPITIRANGILTGGIITGDSGNKVQVTAITGYQQGSDLTVSATSVTGLAAATTGGNQIVYAIVVDSTGALASVAGVSGVASTTRGTAGGPPTIPDTDVVVGYVVRAESASTTVAASEISLTLYDGQERACNPSPVEIRAVKGQLDYAEALPAVHTSGAKRVYVSGFTQDASMCKVANLIDWRLGVTREREDTTTLEANATSSDPGKLSYTASFNKYIAEAADAIFDHTNDADRGDFIVKFYPNQFDSSTYYVCQAGIDFEEEFPTTGKSRGAGTLNITGRVEKIS